MPAHSQTSFLKCIHHESRAMNTPDIAKSEDELYFMATITKAYVKKAPSLDLGIQWLIDELIELAKPSPNP